jgi:hypothetical protein
VHWLILIPYYFFGAITLLALGMLLTRIVRLKVDINVLIGIAIAGSLAAVVMLPAFGIVPLRRFTAWPMLALGVASFVLAALDALLARLLPSPMDESLQGL